MAKPEVYEHRGWNYRAIEQTGRWVAQFRHRDEASGKWRTRCRAFRHRHEALDEALSIIMAAEAKVAVPAWMPEFDTALRKFLKKRTKHAAAIEAPCAEDVDPKSSIAARAERVKEEA